MKKWELGSRLPMIFSEEDQKNKYYNALVAICDLYGEDFWFTFGHDQDGRYLVLSFNNCMTYDWSVPQLYRMVYWGFHAPVIIRDKDRAVLCVDGFPYTKGCTTFDACDDCDKFLKSLEKEVVF
jgi:hypothetical protein